MFKHLDDVKPTDLFTMTSTGLRGHKYKLYKPQAHLDIRKNFFSVRVIDEWNRLPETLLRCSTLSIFKKRLDCFFKELGIRLSSLSFFPLVSHLSRWLVELS